MAAIKGKDTKPELIVRNYLFSRGLRFRIQVRNLPGKPDIVLPKYKTAIFVNGCFWHGHKGCKYYRLPKTNIDFWKNKIEQNISRDAKNEKELISLGWNVIHVWECEIKNISRRKECLEHLYNSVIQPLYNQRYDQNSEDISMVAEASVIYANENNFADSYSSKR